ncbi:hypothetical protein HC02_22075 [Vibrio parahaemolyticus]|nr:hypothetical protein HC02_22075 [Vibrio parahaemolyticus]
MDGDTAGINLPVTITDDIPTIYDSSITRVEGQGTRTVQLFQDPVEGDLNYGADGSELTSFSADDSGIYFKQNGIDMTTVDLNGSNQTVFVHKTLNGVDTEIGRLIVRLMALLALDQMTILIIPMRLQSISRFMLRLPMVTAIRVPPISTSP